jgi:hypothetical protein
VTNIATDPDFPGSALDAVPRVKPRSRVTTAGGIDRQAACRPSEAMARLHLLAVVPAHPARQRRPIARASQSQPRAIEPVWPSSALGQYRELVAAGSTFCIRLFLPRRSDLKHLGAVHLPQRIGDQLEPRAVGVTEVDRRAALLEVLDSGLVELALEVLQVAGSTGMAMWCSPPSTSAYVPT